MLHPEIIFVKTRIQFVGRIDLFVTLFLPQKYWIEKESNRNCFILFAQHLSITWGEDNRFWNWPLVKESR